MRKYIMDDILKRTLQFIGYDVKHVMNITDVGHLTDDNDSGEDKLEKGARKHGKTVWDVAREYTDFFHETMKHVNVSVPDTEPKATDHIQAMIALIQELERKGFTYETDEAIYFDTQRFPHYGELSKQKVEEKKQGVREDVHVDSSKHHPADFALWFKRTGRFADHSMHWESPWGDGFPGWHIECSAMSMEYLGKTLDIHTGGIDHIPVHHENEIAQSEAATDAPFVRFWVHHNFLMVEGQKMSKSLGNVYTYKDLEERGIDPISLRLLFMQTHYRQEMNFTWEAAKAANEALKRLHRSVLDLQHQCGETIESDDIVIGNFRALLGHDLDTPKAIAYMWEVLKSDLTPTTKLGVLYSFDQVLGLGLQDVKEEALPAEIQNLINQRNEARKNRDWALSDDIRKKIEELGWEVKDLPNGSFYSKLETRWS